VQCGEAAEDLQHFLARLRPLFLGPDRYYVGQTAVGERVVRQDYTGYDDYRTYWFVPADVARRWALAYANSAGITLDQAREWLSKYAGCHGADLYQAVVEAEAGSPLAPQAEPPRPQADAGQELQA